MSCRDPVADRRRLASSRTLPCRRQASRRSRPELIGARPRMRLRMRGRTPTSGDGRSASRPVGRLPWRLLVAGRRTVGGPSPDPEDARYLRSPNGPPTCHRMRKCLQGSSARPTLCSKQSDFDLSGKPRIWFVDSSNQKSDSSSL